MKITIEVTYPNEKPVKYSYEDETWDHSIEEFLEITEGLMKQMGYSIDGRLTVEDGI